MQILVVTGQIDSDWTNARFDVSDWADAGFTVSVAAEIDTDLDADILIVSPSIAEPLASARAFRKRRPSGQILFIVPPERLDRMRGMLPFSPEISEAWILDESTPVPELRRLVGEASATVENRRAIRGLYRRINAQIGMVAKVADNDTASRERQHRALAERYLTAILANAPDALIATSLDGSIVSWNDAAIRLFGKSWDEVAGKNFADFFLPEDRDKASSLLSQAGLGKSIASAELRIGTRGNTHQTLELAAGPILGGGSSAIEGVSLTARDITIRKRDLARLYDLNAGLERQVIERSRERGRTWQVSPDLLSIINANGLFESTNPAWRTVLGWAEEELAGAPYLDFVHSEDILRSQAAFKDVKLGKPVLSFENRYCRKDGAYRWLSWVAVPEDGKLYCSARDITVEKERAEALAGSEARLRAIFETSHQLQGLLALDGTLLDTNATSLAVIQSKLEDVVGQPFWNTPWFTGTAGMPEAVRAAVSAAAKGETIHQEISLNVPGGLRSYDFAVRPICDKHGEVIAILPEAVDITERRQAEEQLRQSQKMQAIGQLTGGIAHDFNNLLTGISGSLELLQARVSQGRLGDIDRYILAAQGAAKRAAALTHRLLAFSRRQTLDPKPTDINRLVADMEELIRRTVGPAITVETVRSAGLWPVLCDPNQLENALLNLCINARDAMPDGGRLMVETSNRWLDERAAQERDLPLGQYVSLCVSDNGTGMTQEVIARAFDPFFTTKPLGLGTGLGLSMIYGFAQQSGGQVRIYSEHGQGTMVCIYLPRQRGKIDDAELDIELVDAPRAEAGETVLIVDDEPTVRMLVTEVLEELGYTAIEASDGAGGLKALQSKARIDLLITDVGLPGGMNGRQLADAARVARPDLKVLFITGYAENAVISHGHLESGMHVLIKPFAMEALGRRIKTLIADP